MGFFKYFGETPPTKGDLNINKTYIQVSEIQHYELISLQRDKFNDFGVMPPIQEIIEEYSDNYSMWMFNKVEPVFSYCFREIIRNVFEHSGALRCSIFGQIYERRNEIEICIADPGKGIRNSLANKYGDYITDQWALEKSILPGYTSASVIGKGKYDNSGFGLFVLSEIAKKFGYMVIASGEKLLRVSRTETKIHDYYYPGTYVGLNFKYKELLDNRELILQIISEGEKIAKTLGIEGKASTSTKTI